MGRRLKIGLRAPGLDTLGSQLRGNVQGDEVVARGWLKYLQRRSDVDRAELYGPDGVVAGDLDVLIHFQSGLELQPGIKNLLYLQNAYPKEKYEGGTVGVFQRCKDSYDAYLFTSERLMNACAPGAVIPFATDPEFFFPQVSKDFEFPVSFVGNNIRGKTVNKRYLYPARHHGLVIYGRRWKKWPLKKHALGKLPMPDLPKLYSSCKINLNAHLMEHVEQDTINLRIYDALACKGFLISDHVDSIETVFGDAVICTQGKRDLRRKLRQYLGDPEERRRRADLGHAIVTGAHTYAHRMAVLVPFLRDVV